MGAWSQQDSRGARMDNDDPAGNLGRLRHRLRAAVAAPDARPDMLGPAGTCRASSPSGTFGSPTRTAPRSRSARSTRRTKRSSAATRPHPPRTARRDRGARARGALPPADPLRHPGVGRAAWGGGYEAAGFRLSTGGAPDGDPVAGRARCAALPRRRHRARVQPTTTRFPSTVARRRLCLVGRHLRRHAARRLGDVDDGRRIRSDVLVGGGKRRRARGVLPDVEGRMDQGPRDGRRVAGERGSLARRSSCTPSASIVGAARRWSA